MAPFRLILAVPLVEPRKTRHPPSDGRGGGGLGGFWLGEFGQLGDSAVNVVALSSQRMHLDRLTPGVPGSDVAEVGPAGMSSEADQERSGQAPGWVRVQLGDAEGSGREAVEAHGG